MHGDAKIMADCTVLTGANLDHLPTFADCTFDSCVTDPPYELGFMGKAWDKSGIAYNLDLWREVYRVLKPGAYLLAFGGSRTYHRLASAIEDAGFEIRDQIQWIYGSGFPKSLDVSKAIDKAAGEERKVVGTTTSGKILRSNGDNERPYQQGKTRLEQNVTVAASDAAKTWDGWGTALKPAHEPIVMARKPLEKGLTVAQNVLKWGTGAINVDKCRVPHDEPCNLMKAQTDDEVMTGNGKYGQAGRRVDVLELKPSGRFPANVIHDGSDEVLAAFPHTASGLMKQSIVGGDFNVYGKQYPRDVETIGDEGSAARFFYSPKASKYDREAGLPEAGRGVGALRDGNRPELFKLRDDLTDQERAFVLAELKKNGVIA